MIDRPDPTETAKSFRRGTHRTVAPEATVERVSRLAPVLGITRVANVTGLDVIGLPVVMVTRPNSRSLAVSQGKGLDLAAAKASGLMEAAELWHAERIDRPLRLATHNEVRFERKVADLARLPRLSIGSFHDELRMLWIEGSDLFTGEPRLLPFETVHIDTTQPLPPGSGCFPLTSNGLASGNHPLEAVIHALCELIERDSTTLWQLAAPERRAETRLDLASVDDPSCREVLAAFERAGVALGVWETTSDLGVPAYRALIADREADPFHPRGGGGGYGCHPAREVALLRAITEAAQGRLTSIAGARDDMPKRSYEAWHDPDGLETLRRDLVDGAPGRRFQEAPSFDGASFEQDAAWLLGRLAAAGLTEAVLVDLTHPSLGLPVVRVVVPGLEAPREILGWTPGERARAAAERRSP
ncbi:MAG TPA: YcaO-like family protein [Thermoanaerobaculia bacterium]|nr:YcaO-like family protein [Thermoanaerobaculia bacterium]